MYTILPISAISGGIGVILPLYILAAHGTVYNVAIAITLFELVSIPAGLFWGELTDRLNKIKLFVIISIIGLFPLLLILYFIAFVPVIESSYGVYAFIATASSPAINILIMSRKRNPALPRYYSRYSILAIVGGILGTLPGLFINSSLIKQYLILLLVLNVIALVMTYFFIQADESIKAKKKTQKTVKKSFAILNMLSVTPYILTGHALIERIRAGLKVKKIRNIYILLATIALFNLGLYLFNTSYIPYLSSKSIDYSNIFLISITNSIAQLGIYVGVVSFLKKMNLDRSYKMSLFIRSVGYTFVLIPAVILPRYILAFNLIGYFIAGIAYAVWNIASSVLLYQEIRNLGRGHYIGIYTALVGLSAVAGAYASGIISAQLGYVITFSAAIVAIFFSSVVFNYLVRQRGVPEKKNI
jgi:MFS family permease